MGSYGPMLIRPRGRISHGYFSDKIFIIRCAHAAANTSRGGMALDLENEDIHSR